MGIGSVQVLSIRDAIVSAILEFLAGQDPSALQNIRQRLEREIDEAGPDALLALKDRVTADSGWEFSPPDPLARRIHAVLAETFLDRESALEGGENALELGDAPVVICSNHLSYSDANAIEVLLRRFGRGALADRLTALAGPKVFTSRERRFSSLCFGTVKVPQSTEVSSEEAVLNARDVARAARRAIEISRERLSAGDALILFGEGTRSRACAMQPMLAAAARYVEMPGVQILPAALTGSEELFPVGFRTIQPARIVLRLGQPIDAAALLAAADGDKRLVMDAIGLAIAALLPESYRGVYGNRDEFPQALELLSTARRVD